MRPRVRTRRPTIVVAVVATEQWASTVRLVSMVRSVSTAQWASTARSVSMRRSASMHTSGSMHMPPDAYVTPDAYVPIDAYTPPDAPVPPDGPPPPPKECEPEAADKYGDITLLRQKKPAQGTWARVAMVSWDMFDSTRKATVQEADAGKKKNLDEIDKFVAVAKKQCVDLLIFPEMAVVGYPTKESDQSTYKTTNFRSREEVAGYIEKLPPIGTARNDIDPAKWPSTRRLANAAADNGIALHAGLLEHNGDNAKPFNTALVFDKSGALIARHRKHNVNDPLPLDPADEENENKTYYERVYLSEGADATVYAHPKIGRVGVMTCADMYPSMNAAGTIQEMPPFWREKYLTAGFAFMSVSSAWNDPWKKDPDPEWFARTQARKLSKWANPGMEKRYVGFSNTKSNGEKVRVGYTAFIEPIEDDELRTADDRVIVIGYVPAP
jgi:predicted amidohydrolase